MYRCLSSASDSIKPVLTRLCGYHANISSFICRLNISLNTRFCVLRSLFVRLSMHKRCMKRRTMRDRSDKEGAHPQGPLSRGCVLCQKNPRIKNNVWVCPSRQRLCTGWGGDA
ncbi:hypothetical protein ERIC2_c26650 [Paenibacillus larvae subsp. larvae DSM 25430]|uniref:Uncharacterized protein n=1 Tax=Paenibacillus larvae subsp. larvae DSM 25430 TaxID=697284 RepID=V9WBF9_9BACL|nr:hypothetical protein ERIC2_c26650 [Paenibacillus larvae subsp. larvae DSM 25430]